MQLTEINVSESLVLTNFSFLASLRDNIYKDYANQIKSNEYIGIAKRYAEGLQLCVKEADKLTNRNCNFVQEWAPPKMPLFSVRP